MLNSNCQYAGITGRRTFLLLIYLFVFSISFTGQETGQEDTVIVSSNENLLNENSGESKKINSHSHTYKIRRAWMLSAVIPGAGQIYNQKYWKAPIVWTGLAVSAYFFKNNAKQSVYYENAYFDYIKEQRGMPNDQSYKDLKSLQEANLDWDNLTSREADYIQQYLDNNRKNYKRNRDLNIILILGIYFLNIVDAAVDAHFFEFDVSEDLKVHWQPDISTGNDFSSNYGIRCVINF